MEPPMRRSRLLPIVAVVIMASLLLASCSASPTSESRPWWQPSKDTTAQVFTVGTLVITTDPNAPSSSCGPPEVLYRINSGAVDSFGNCLWSPSANSAPNVTLQTGDQLEIHMEGPSPPSSSNPAVLDLSGRSDNGATSTFVAKSSGTAAITVRSACREDPNNDNGTCLVLQVTVS